MDGDGGTAPRSGVVRVLLPPASYAGSGLDRLGDRGVAEVSVGLSGAQPL